MKHNPRDCRLCASLRHPGTAREGRALARHLAEHPFPKQDPNTLRGEGR
ncbi:hypothetical protein JS756_03025 [Streptomyces actuosus]|uniref:Uncharacterized protein n=1 Tax=Streptomyces actuosus TaxID=1885 RepID=A0ABS2VJ31_STRAS|nr:hypothetical protein [Streptomyces actuosus]MBN0043102.1 hypothetical protein [Streptomyces actuosus]